MKNHRRALLRFGLVIGLIASTSGAEANFLDDVIKSGEDLGRTAWHATTGALAQGGKRVANLAIDSGGKVVAYQVVRGSRSVLDATVENGLLREQGGKLFIKFKNGAVEVGEVVVDEAGNISGTVASGIKDAALYAYKEGAIVIRDLASLSCSDIARLVGGGGNARIEPDLGGVKACGANVAAGFVCALPGAIESLVSDSSELVSNITSASRSGICKALLVPPAGEVCGATTALSDQVTQAAKCLIKTIDLVKAQKPSGFALNESKCRDIGGFALGLSIDMVKRTSAAKNIPKRVAELVSLIMDASDAVGTVNGLKQLPEECKPILPPPAPPVSQPTLWTDSRFKGKSFVVTADSPRLPVGIAEAVSSIQLPKATSVAVFAEPDYRGVCDSFSTDVPTMGLSNVGHDHASSIKVGQLCPGTPVVRVFKNTKYAGRAVELAFDVPDLKSIGLDRAISSVKWLGPPKSLALYSLPGYGGTCRTVSWDEPGSSFQSGNDFASSLRIDRPCPTSVAVQTFTTTKFGGSSQQFFADVPDTVAASANNMSSIKVFGGKKAALYKDTWFRGACATVSGDTPKLPSGFNDSVRSIRVDADCGGYAWIGSYDAILTASGLCLTGKPDGTVITAPCDRSPSQGWTRTSGDQLVNRGASQCLAITPSLAGTAGAPVFLEACNPNALHQRFYPRGLELETAPSKAGVTWVGWEGRCIEIAARDLFVPGARVQLGNCSAGVAQTFRLRPANTTKIRPALGEVPTGQELHCPFDLLTKGSLACLSGPETFSVAFTDLSSDSASLPPDGFVTLHANGFTLPRRATHEPAEHGFSASIWFSTTETKGQRTMLAKGNAGAKGAGYSIFSSEGVLVFRVSDGTSTAAVKRALPADGKWHHLAVVVDRKNALLAWLDGSSKEWSAGGGDATSSSIASVGAIQSDAGLTVGGTWEGRLDEVRLFRRPLTESEIATLAKQR